MMVSVLKEMAPEMFVEGGVVAAGQTFHRRLAEYEMNIEQQKLLREDLRDLVELTVGRMDIYHLVGAMLLEFCISFYCENKMVEGATSENDSIPSWVLTFFLLCNLSAAGYLIFAVWLSMHASVASHSIGVRLLTRFARLSIPSRSELEEVAKAPLVPLMNNFLKLSKEKLFGPGTPGGKAKLSPRPVAGDSSVAGAARSSGDGGGGTGTASLRRSRSMSPVSERSGGQAYAGTGGSFAINEGARVQGDKTLHFRRFLKEQRRWICYDAYARVCMSLGINQMMAALSYYSVGVYIESAPSAALLTLAGTQLLACLLLRLDVLPSVHRLKELVTVLVLVPLPPIYLGTILAVVRYNPKSVDKHIVAWMAVPAYFMHGAWLFVVSWMLCPTPTSAGGSGLGLPKQLRTVMYLDVLHMEQDEAEHAVKEGEIKDRVRELQVARANLEQAMLEVVEEERCRGSVSSLQRDGAQKVQAAARDIQALLEELRSNTIFLARDALLDRESRNADRALERLTLWRSAPEIHHMLTALRSSQAQGWLSDDQKATIEKSYRDFFTRCKELDLGFFDRSTDGAPKLLRVISGEELNVKFNCANEYDAGLGLPMSVWVTAHSDRPELFEPRGLTTSYSRTFDEDGALANFQDAAKKWSSPEQSRRPLEQEPERGPAARPANGAKRRLGTRAYSEHFATFDDQVEDGTPSQFQVGSSQPSDRVLPELLPQVSTPPESLPGIIVRRFSCGLGCLWMVAGSVQILECIFPKDAPDILPPHIKGDELDVRWPHPASLFQVAWLACDATRLMVNNKFALYSVPHTAQGAWSAFVRVAETTGPGTVMCDEYACDVLSFDRHRGWSLAPTGLGDDGGGSSALTVVALPEAWRLVAAVRPPCGPDLGEPCQDVLLAGWDGESVVIAGAAATGRRADAPLQVKSRFALRRPPGGRGAVGAAYSDVLAMNFGPRGQTLFVLSAGSHLEAWDVTAGRRLGAWLLDAPRPGLQAPHAMCHDGSGLLVAHAAAEDGLEAAPPALSRVPLPREALQVEGPCGGHGCREPAAEDEREVVVV